MIKAELNKPENRSKWNEDKKEAIWIIHYLRTSCGDVYGYDDYEEVFDRLIDIIDNL